MSNQVAKLAANRDDRKRDKALSALGLAKARANDFGRNPAATSRRTTARIPHAGSPPSCLSCLRRTGPLAIADWIEGCGSDREHSLFADGADMTICQVRESLRARGTPRLAIRLREVELRGDRRAAAVLGLMLFGGLRVSDVVGLELDDVIIGPRSGQVTCRHGKGNKQRIVPLPCEARRTLTGYLETRPPTESRSIFIGERGALTDDGVRAICSKYAAITGVKFTPHVLRHTFAHRFLEQTNNDLVALAQILGHENLQTTSIYTKRSQDDLQERIEGIRYE